MVTLICLSDRPACLRLLLASLALQTYSDWQLLVLDQSDEYHVQSVVDAFDEHRVVHERVPRVGDWGQTEKYRAVSRVVGEWVGFPNDDAYYAPRFLELMVERGQQELDLVYCDWVSAADMQGYPYYTYAVEPRTGHIDVGGFLVRRSVIASHGWVNRGPTGDGHLVETLVQSGVRHARVPSVLYVKN